MEDNQQTASLSQHLPSWDKLVAHRQQWSDSLSQLFEASPERAEQFSLEAGPLFLDYSKSHLTETTLDLLLQLSQEAGLGPAIDELLSGQTVNHTEQRPAWHSALRTPPQNSPEIKQAVQDAKNNMSHFVQQLHSQQWLGHSGTPITDVVNIGIGGSDLGPRMACQALCDFHQPQLKVHFVANIDGAEIHHTLKTLDPATTLFIVASKSFETQETLANATTARQWLLDNQCPTDTLKQHFVAISSNIKKATNFGIEPNNIFPLWDWVGGRYSLWSCIGLPIALTVGWSHFEALLEGAAEMDQHFATAPHRHNMPVLLALLNFWYSQCWDAKSQAVLPYCHQLHRLPDFLQQLDMESLGKAVNRQGHTVDYPTGMALWGTEESNGQHSFHQLLHQGSQMIPLDFITSISPNHPHDQQHRQLLISCLSQGQALLVGKSLQQAQVELSDNGLNKTQIDTLAPHKVIAGNRPSNTLLLDRLNPRSLGNLIALYEHKVYALSILLNINAFDQWGVELGKQLGTQMSHVLSSKEIPECWDSSTRQLAEKILSHSN